MCRIEVSNEGFVFRKKNNNNNDNNYYRRLEEKLEKYQDSKRDIGRIWGMRKVQVVLVMIGALGNVAYEFDKWIEKLDIPSSGLTRFVKASQPVSNPPSARIM